jgi:hypothetical protein
LAIGSIIVFFLDFTVIFAIHRTKSVSKNTVFNPIIDRERTYRFFRQTGLKSIKILYTGNY